METLGIVIALYNENSSWIHKLIEIPNVKIYIYLKKHERLLDIQKEFPTCVIEVLKNQGRESHTYLYHIIHNYDVLDDITIFTQGTYSDHCEMSVDKFRDVFSNIDAYSKNYMDSTCWGGYRRYYNFKIKYWTAEVKNEDKEYGPWFESVFNQPFNDSTIVYRGGIFSVSKSTILKRPKSFYEMLLKEVEYDNNPIEGHFMERSWLEVFCIDSKLG